MNRFLLLLNEFKLTELRWWLIYRRAPAYPDVCRDGCHHGSPHLPNVFVKPDSIGEEIIPQWRRSVHLLAQIT